MNKLLEVMAVVGRLKSKFDNAKTQLTVDQWLEEMGGQLAIAKEEQKGNKDKSLSSILVMLAMGVACLEQHGTEDRK